MLQEVESDISLHGARKSHLKDKYAKGTKEIEI